MQIFNYKFSIILNFLLVFALISVLLLFVDCQNKLAPPSQEEASETTPGFWELAEYPDNLLEGKVISLNLEEPITLVIEADVSKIIPDSEKMEKTIKIVSDTELILHEVTPEADSPMELSELKSGDYVIVAITESTREGVLTKDTFTALKVTKIRSLE